jgi:hypothetical protein
MDYITVGRIREKSCILISIVKGLLPGDCAVVKRLSK